MEINKTNTLFIKIIFLALAIIPLLKPNYNSISIILCAIFCFLTFLKTKQKSNNKSRNLLLTLPFFMFLFYELISGNFNLNVVLLGLPFLIFPLIFHFKPLYINVKILKLSFFIFQISVLVQSFIYLIIFLKQNPLKSLFNISKENIPFFREFVTSTYLIEMHPTYFSSFLLFSLTITLFKFKSNKYFHILNLVITSFLIMLFSSKIIILILILTIILFTIYVALRSQKKKAIIIGVLGFIFLGFILNTNIVKERFYEIKEQMNKPIVGDYYNSSNTRLAILKCDFLLMKRVPFFGFGENLQEQLDNCYAENNDSEFYKINVFNTHNYYIHIILYGGWLFFLLYLFYLSYIFIRIKNNTFHLFIFFQFLLINLTENYLSRHYGVVIFCYFTILFITINKDEENSTIKHI